MTESLYKEKIVNVETGEEIWRNYEPEEIAEIEKEQAKIAANLAERAQIETARKAILERLGVTAEEAKLLFS